MGKIGDYLNDLKLFPKAAPYIIGNEAAERFSFYGMKAILTTFLAATFYINKNNPEAAANDTTHMFVAGAYLCSFIGGFLADWVLGKYKTILWLSIVYCLGHLFLAIFDYQPTGFMFGLVLIAVGAGGIKPCVSANVGDQFDNSNKHLLPKLYDVFYFSINFGAFFSQLFIPYLKENYGASVAFGVPGILMAIATVIFWLGRDRYKSVPPSGYPKINVAVITLHALSKLGSTKPGQSIWQAAEDKYKKENIDNTRSVWKVILVFSFMPVFWALYDQNGSEWVQQAKHLNLTADFRFWIFQADWLKFTVIAETIQSVNAILILVFVPLFTIFLYPGLNAAGVKVNPLRKFGAGFILTILAFVVIAYIEMMIQAGQQPNMMWQVLAYAILTAGEVLVSVSGLEYAYSMAPPQMKSTVMAIWFFTVFVGNLFVSLINKSIESMGFFSQFKGADYYWFFAGVMAVNTVLFIILSLFLANRDNNKEPVIDLHQ
jgi:POT family proton-dependent oligopeptide transporter